ncbi:MAG: DNA-directed RNA polymerase subunit omega [Acidobacteria bacterium]|nr:DNA-directed RNA polymerase subunit omega [Acidobacteriota bacterium]
MTDESDSILGGDVDSAPAFPVAMPRTPAQPAPLITNRFLFVDVASQRVKQLRRGALPRLAQFRPNPETGERPPVTLRLERLAMEEVAEGLVEYNVPPQNVPETDL